MKRFARTLEKLEGRVAFASVSASGNLEITTRMAGLFEAAGARVPCDKAGGFANLVAAFGPEAAVGAPLPGHCHVVPVVGRVRSGASRALARRGQEVFGRAAPPEAGLFPEFGCDTGDPRTRRHRRSARLDESVEIAQPAACLGLLDRLTENLPENLTAP